MPAPIGAVAGMVKFRLKKVTVHRARIRRSLERGRLRALKRMGGWTKTVARRSIRSGGKKRKHSEPGQPVRYQQRPGIKDNITYRVNEQASTVIIGPRKFKTSKLIDALEQGETITWRQWDPKTKGTVPVVFRYKPRPTMQLALQNASPKFNEFLRGVYN
jgi:hypothetical protein